jgi:Flagellar hook-length control protein FliK
MTAAPAVAPGPAPVAPPPARAASHASADHLAFATVLDSLPSAAAKAAAPATEEQARPSNESTRQESSREQTAHRPLPNDSALFASLPFALRAASMTEERPQAADNSPSVASATVTGPKSEDSGGSIAAGAKASVGRLIGERAFHFGATASRTFAASAPLAPAGASAANLTPIDTPARSLAGAVPASAAAMASAPIASPKGAPSSSNRASPARAAAHNAARSAVKPEDSAPPPVARASGSASPPAAAGSNAKTVDGRSPDPTASAAPSPTPTSLFGAELSAPFGVGAPFEPDASATKAAGADVAPRATALAAGSASSAQPIKEIDVDLSPGGLEDVSMTMRLAGDKLSVVIRAASSQTLGSIEGARDAITDRLAAIGQPLDSLIVRQAGVNTNADTNGTAASAEDGSTGETWRSAQGASEWGGSDDASSRRGAGRDRNF